MSVLQRLSGYLAPINQALWARERRERLLLGGAALLLAGALWYFYSFEPRQQAIEQAYSQAEQAEQEIGSLEAQREELLAELEEDPGAELRDEITELESELETVRARLEEEVPEFIDPERMRDVLEDLLARRSGVELLQFERMSTELVLEGGDDGEGIEIYGHPVRAVLKADYASTVRFLADIEALPWEFAWEELNYEVTEVANLTERPQARVEIRLYTLSGHEAWLGI